MNSHTSQPLSPWETLPTLGFSLIIFIVFVVIQTIALIAFAFLQLQIQPGGTLLELVATLPSNGFAISVSLIPGALVGSLCVLGFASLRKNITVREYLYLKPPTLKQFLLWMGLLILLAIGIEVINHFLQRPTPDWMLDTYQTAEVLPLFWFTLVIAAPLFEELLFRGFLLEGLRHSRLGNFGAILITAALWAVIHIQYELFEVVSIFLVGILLGYARIQSQSLYTPIAMHALMNLAATVQVAMWVD